MGERAAEGVRAIERACERAWACPSVTAYACPPLTTGPLPRVGSSRPTPAGLTAPTGCIAGCNGPPRAARASTPAGRRRLADPAPGGRRHGAPGAVDCSRPAGLRPRRDRPDQKGPWKKCACGRRAGRHVHRCHYGTNPIPPSKYRHETHHPQHRSLRADRQQDRPRRRPPHRLTLPTQHPTQHPPPP